MRRRPTTALAMTFVFGAQAPMFAAGELEGASSSKRPFALFLSRSTFFGLNPIDIPINPKSNRISDTLRLVGGELDGTTWHISGDGSFLGLVRKAYTFGGSNHPNSNLVGLFSSSEKASAELKLADEAAARGEGYMVWAYGFVVAAAIPLALASMDRSQPATANPLFYGGAGLRVAGLVPGFMSLRARQDSWNHLGRAVKAWNAGQ